MLFARQRCDPPFLPQLSITHVEEKAKDGMGMWPCKYDVLTGG